MAVSDVHQKPNILMIMTDQQRYDSLGCYGLSVAHTPNLDRLASLFHPAVVCLRLPVQTGRAC
jgi:hypothetical protein